MKIVETCHFLLLINSSVINNSVTFATIHISNHVIKSDQYFSSLTWIVLFNIFKDILNII